MSEEDERLPVGKRGSRDIPFSMVNFEKINTHLDENNPILIESFMFMKEKKGLKKKYVKFVMKYTDEDLLQIFGDEGKVIPDRVIDMKKGSFTARVKMGSCVHPYKFNLFTPKGKRLKLAALTQIDFGEWKRVFQNTLKEKDKYKKKKREEDEILVFDDNVGEYPIPTCEIPSFQSERWMTKPFKDWSHVDFLGWTKQYRTGASDESFYDQYSEHLKKHKELTGKYLCENVKSAAFTKLLISFQVREYYDRLVFKKDIMIMKTLGYFDIRRHVAKEKAVILHGKHKVRISPIDLYRWLDNKREMYRFLEITKKLRKLYGLKKKKRKKKKKKNKPLAIEEIDTTSLTSSLRFRLKLIITENLQDERMKKFRKMLGFGLKMVPKDIASLHFGFFHVALSIGAVQYDWNDSGFVHLRKTYSRNVILCLDVDNLVVKESELDDFLGKLVKRMMYWNTNHKYDSMKCNCQHFVLDFLRVIGVDDYKFGPVTERFLDKMKYKGVSEMQFEMESSFFKKFKSAVSQLNPKHLEGRIFKPQTHGELDEFVWNLLDVCPTFQTSHYIHWELLKGFDRAFWMKNMREKQTLPKRNMASARGCPFNVSGDKFVSEVSEDEIAKATEEEDKEQEQERDSVVGPNYYGSEEEEEEEGEGENIEPLSEKEKVKVKEKVMREKEKEKESALDSILKKVKASVEEEQKEELKKYKNELITLSEMGFTNEKRNLELLKKHGGQVEAVVKESVHSEDENDEDEPKEVKKKKKKRKKKKKKDGKKDGKKLKEETMEEKLRQLADMGFDDEKKNIELLEKHKGKVESVVSEIICS